MFDENSGITFIVVARIDCEGNQTFLSPITTPVTMFNKKRFDEVSEALNKLGYAVMIVPSKMKSE